MKPEAAAADVDPEAIKTVLLVPSPGASADFTASKLPTSPYLLEEPGAKTMKGPPFHIVQLEK